MCGARDRQHQRYGTDGPRTNAGLRGRGITTFCRPDSGGRELLRRAVDQLGLSARGYDRVLMFWLELEMAFWCAPMKHMQLVLLTFIYLTGTFVVYLAFTRYPDDSVTTIARWFMLYVVAVVYPAAWTWRHVRTLRRLGLYEKRELRGFVWAPVIVGGTSLIFALSLLLRIP